MIRWLLATALASLLFLAGALAVVYAMRILYPVPSHYNVTPLVPPKSTKLKYY
jgi:hypothetical protein